MEVKPFGIDVVVIEPGGIATEWGDIAADNLKPLISACGLLGDRQFDAVISRAIGLPRNR